MRQVAGDIPENEITLISEILQKVVGYSPVSIEHLNGLGMSNAVTVVTTEQGRFVVRTNVESHLFRYKREAWCYQQLKGSSVLTPTVLGCGTHDGFAYSVAEFITDSRPVSDAMDTLRMWRILGSYARSLNQISPPEHGTEAASYFPISWEQQVADDVELIFRGELWLAEALLSASQQDSARQYLLSCASSTAPRGICQFDLTTANAVICGDDYQRVFLLDLEWANIAPVPYYQLGCIAAEKGLESNVYRAFFDGYGLDTTRISAELERFTLYRLMRATAWARDRRPNLVSENIERTRPILERALRRDFSE